MPATRVQRCCGTSSILPKGEKILPDAKKILENMKYLDFFVVRKQTLKRTPLVFIKTQQNHPYFIACFVALKTPGLAPCKTTLEMEPHNRLVIAAACLDSSSPSASCVWKTSQIAGGGSLRGRRWTNRRAVSWAPSSTIPAPSAVTLWNYQVHQEGCFWLFLHGFEFNFHATDTIRRMRMTAGLWKV